MKISIITPNYNYSKFISNTIESILCQEYSNFEHIIVDDGSTDNSVKIIESYILKYPKNIRLIKQNNRGQSFALNTALKYINGDIICWLNSDDMFCSNVFKSIVARFNDDQNIDAIFGDIYIIDESGEKIKVIKYLPFDYKSGIFNGFGKIIPSNAIFWRYNISKKIAGFNNQLIYSMDADYWSRILYKKNVIHIPEIIAQFRWHNKAKTITRRDKNSTAYKRAKYEDNLVFENSYKKLGISKILPSKISFPIKVIYKVKRYFLRLLNGHYFND